MGKDPVDPVGSVPTIGNSTEPIFQTMGFPEGVKVNASKRTANATSGLITSECEEAQGVEVTKRTHLQLGKPESTDQQHQLGPLLHQDNMTYRQARPPPKKVILSECQSAYSPKANDEY